MSSKTDELIGRLSAELRPVKVVRFTWIDTLKVAMVGCLCLFSTVAILGLRSDFFEQSISVRFVLESVLLLSLGMTSIVAAFGLSVPSLEGQKFYKIPVFVFVAILLSTTYSFFTSSAPFLYLGHGFSCVAKVLSVGILPASILFYRIRRAATLKRDIVGVLVLAAGVSFGLLGVQLTCPDSTPLHITLWHILPSLAVMALGVYLARKIVKKI